MSAYEHYKYHFDEQGLCQCGCEECHLRLTGLCVCPGCPCDDPEHTIRDGKSGLPGFPWSGGVE